MPPQDAESVRDDLNNASSNPEDSNKDSGWTHVTAKSRRGRRNRPAKAQELPIKARTSDLVPPEEFLADYQRFREKWLDDTCCRRLRELVARHSNGIKISKAIHLGIGSFDPHHGAWDAKRSTFIQLIAFLIIVEELEKASAKKIPCIFQEPMFSQSDKEFLTNLGHQVVEPPEANFMVDQDTLLVGFHLYRGIYAEALKNCLPAIFVGTAFNVWDDLGRTDYLEQLETMDKDYKRSPFPQETHGSAFSGTTMYFRPVIETVSEATKQNEEDSTAVEADLSNKLESMKFSE